MAYIKNPNSVGEKQFNHFVDSNIVQLDAQLHSDGSIRDSSGAILKPANPVGARIFAKRIEINNVELNAQMNEDGSISEKGTTGGGGSITETDPIYSADKPNIALNSSEVILTGDVTLNNGNGTSINLVNKQRVLDLIDNVPTGITEELDPIFEAEKINLEKNHVENTLTNVVTLTTGNNDTSKVYNQNKVDNELNLISVEQTTQNNRLDLLEANPGTGLPNYAGIYLNGIVRIPPILSSTPNRAKFENSDNDYYTASLNVGDYSDFVFKETGVYKVSVNVNGTSTNPNTILHSTMWKNGTLINGTKADIASGNFSVIYEFIINVTNTSDIYNFGAFDDGAGSITLTNFFSITSKQSEALKTYVTLNQFNLSQSLQDLKINANETNITNNANDIATILVRLSTEEAKSSNVISTDDITFTFVDKNGTAGKSWKVGGLLNDIGDFNTIADLPPTGNAGDIANVTNEIDTDLNGLYYWNGTSWVKYEITVDLSDYYTKAEIDNIVSALNSRIDGVESLLTKAVADILILDYALVQLNNKVNINTANITSNATNITNLQNKDIDLQSQIDALVDSKLFDYVVPTFADLPATALENELALVLSDVNYSDLPTYYKWTGGTWVYQANYVKDYYTKAESDAQLLLKADADSVYSKTEINSTFAEYSKHILSVDDATALADSATDPNNIYYTVEGS